MFTGQNGIIFFLLENVLGAANVTSDPLIPVNPLEVIKTPKVDYTIEKHQYSNHLTTSKIVTGIREHSEVELEGFFKDPWLGLNIFTIKEFDDDWNATPEEVVANFDGYDDQSSIGMYNREADLEGTDDIDRLFKGGRIISRFLVVEMGKNLREKLKIRFIDKEESGEVTQLDVKAKADIHDADYVIFHIMDTDGVEAKHYIWFDVTGGGADPVLGGTAHEVDISGAATENSVAVLVAAVIDAISDISCSAIAAAAENPGRVTFVNSFQGDVTDATQEATGCCDSIIILSEALPSDFSDGEWADWWSDKIIHSIACSIKWGGNEINDVNSGFEISKITFGVEAERETLHVSRSLVAQLEHISSLTPTCEIEGYLTKNVKATQHNFIEELEALVEDKTTATLQLIIDDDATETKYDQFTNAFLADIDGLPDKPKAGEMHKVTLKFEGEKSDYSLSYKYDAAVYTVNPKEIVKHKDV